VALVTEARVDLRVEEIDRTGTAAICELPDELAVDAKLIATLGGIVGDAGQQPRVSTSRLAIPFGRAPAYTIVSRA